MRLVKRPGTAATCVHRQRWWAIASVLCAGLSHAALADDVPPGMNAPLALDNAPVAADVPYTAGDRLFPATPTTDVPFVGDDVYAWLTHLRQNGSPNFGDDDLTIEGDRRLTDNLGVRIVADYLVLDPLHQSRIHGFDNFGANLKYQVFVSDVHETLVSIGITREFGGTGANQVGAASVSTTTPTAYFGKGFGDLPDSLKYLRPLAVTGTVGYQISDSQTHGDDHFPNMATFGLALEYSLRYLQGNVQYVGLPPVISRLTPLVEFAYTTPVGAAFGQTPTGVIAPGVIYSQNGIDLAVEAQIPVNRQTGIGVGFIAALRIPLAKLAPISGKPLFGD